MLPNLLNQRVLMGEIFICSQRYRLEADFWPHLPFSDLLHPVVVKFYFNWWWHTHSSVGITPAFPFPLLPECSVPIFVGNFCQHSRRYGNSLTLGCYATENHLCHAGIFILSASNRSIPGLKCSIYPSTGTSLRFEGQIPRHSSSCPDDYSFPGE